MTKDELQALHQNEFSFLLSTDSQPIEEMVRHFPYFSKAQELLAKKYELSSDYRYELQLEKAAYYTHARARLFDFISSKQTKPSQRLEKSEVKTDKIAIDNFADKALKPNEFQQVNTAELVIQPEIPKKDAEAKSEVVSELPKSIDETQAVPIKSISHAETSKEILEEAEENSFVNPIEFAEKPVNERELKEVTAPESITVHEPLLSLPEKREEKKQEKTAEKRDFFEWLDVFSDSIDEQVVSRSPSENKSVTKKTDKRDFNALIDRFIAQEPRIEPKKKNSRKNNENIHDQVVGLNSLKPEKTENLAQNSLSNETLPASETLASLLVKQGNFRQAILMYEKLQLTNQEKRTYFAALIEKIKNENNLQ